MMNCRLEETAQLIKDRRPSQSNLQGFLRLLQWTLVILAVSICVSYASFVALPDGLNIESKTTVLRPPSVAILLQTSPDFFGSRVAQIRETWGARVHAKEFMSLNFVIGEIADGQADMIKSGCAQDYLSAVCRLGFALQFVYDSFTAGTGFEYEWFFFGDDDIYLLPDNLQRLIIALGPDAGTQPHAWCLPGCEMNGCVGFCGGGGLLISRYVLKRIVEERNSDTFPSLVKELEANEPLCGKFHDVSFGFFIEHNRTNLAMTEYPFFPFAFAFSNNIEMYESLRNKNGLSWLYHYPSRGAMYWLDYMVKALGTNQEIRDDGL